MTDEPKVSEGESKRAQRPWWVTKRRWVIGGAVAAVAIAVVLFFVLRGGGRESGSLVGFRALDAGGAVLVWTGNNAEGPSRSWVTRIDAMGKEQWTRPVPEEAMTGGAGPVAITDGVVVVRYGRTGEKGKYTPFSSAAIAFDLETGKQLWDHEIAAHELVGTDDSPITLHTLPSYISDLSVGAWHVAAVDAGQQDFIAGIEARTGRVGWKHHFDDRSNGPVVIPGAFVRQWVGEAIWTEVATGNQSSFNAKETGCAIGNEFVSADDRGRLVARGTGKPERVIAESAFGENEYVLACGRYRDRYIFLVRTGGVGRNNTHAVVIADTNGKRLHQIAVGGRPILDVVQQVEPLRAMLSGDQLPRFAPYAQFVYANEDKTSTIQSLLMLDLETGAIAWRGKPDSRLAFGTIYRAGSRWIWNDDDAPTLAVFDGATGKLVGAVEAHIRHSVNASRESWRAATADTLWIFSGDPATPDAAPVAALDLATLQPRFPPRIVKLTDATERVKAKLGL